MVGFVCVPFATNFSGVSGLHARGELHAGDGRPLDRGHGVKGWDRLKRGIKNPQNQEESKGKPLRARKWLDPIVPTDLIVAQTTIMPFSGVFLQWERP